MDSDSVRVLLRPCWLGWILLAATTRGLVAISLADQPETLTQELRLGYPAAEFVNDDPQLEAWLVQVLATSDAAASAAVAAQPPPPLDLRGTPFRRRVWQELGLIPSGSTISYAELARRLGAPKAVRAVAQACAANPIALAIPCHRVIASNGSLRGYRWGVERKRALLEREAGWIGPWIPQSGPAAASPGSPWGADAASMSCRSLQVEQSTRPFSCR